MPDAAALGCYGLTMHGLPGAVSLAAAAVPDASDVCVSQQLSAAPRQPEFLTEDGALLHLSDGTGIAALDRRTMRAELHVTRPYADEGLLHPLLSGAAGVFNRWLGRDAFHSGAVEIGGRAWALIGDKGRGKSTTLGYLALRGFQVVTDDLLVEENGEVFSGPAFVDLRPDAAEQLGVGRDMGMLGARRRARLDVKPAPFRMPLGGWISLAWGERVELSALPAQAKLPLLFGNRAILRPPVDPRSFVRHAALPCFQLSRPRAWSALAEVADLLIDQLA